MTRSGLGVICVGLGFAGIFIPVLPTTPLLLLAAAAFIRSSDRLYHWLIHHKWFGEYIRNYREHRAVTRSAKITALVFLWTTILYAIIFVLEAWWLRALLGVVAAAVSAHILSLKTMPAGSKQPHTAPAPYDDCSSA
jgi:hypothetical protein